MHLQFASKTLPLPLEPSARSDHNRTNTPSTPSASSSQPQPSGNGSSSIASSSSAVESVYSARAIPIKIYLPLGAPVIQDVVAPLTKDGKLLDSFPVRPDGSYLDHDSWDFVSGKPCTVATTLNRLLPALFPNTSTGAEPYPLAVPFLHGVQLPPDAEMAWLASCSTGADGWLRVGIKLRE